MKGNRFTAAGKIAWSTNIPFLFPKNALVETVIMEEIAREFLEYAKVKHNGKRVLVFCDNLRSAHLAQTVCDIFKEGNVVLCFLPPDLTASIQAIDAEYGRLMRRYIGNSLVDWLMVDKK